VAAISANQRTKAIRSRAIDDLAAPCRPDQTGQICGGSKCKISHLTPGNKRPCCTATAHPLLRLQRARRSMGKMEGREPTWIVTTISKPCLS
jgi:hypothetical protein